MCCTVAAYLAVRGARYVAGRPGMAVLKCSGRPGPRSQTWYVIIYLINSGFALNLRSV